MYILSTVSISPDNSQIIYIIVNTLINIIFPSPVNDALHCFA